MAKIPWDATTVGRWLEEHQPPRHPVLSHMEEFALRNRATIAGPVVGSFLHQLVLTIHAKRIFEFGTTIGYLTLWLAFAAGSDGNVVSVVNEPARRERAQEFAERAGMADRTSFVAGEPMDILNAQDAPWDFVFVDLGKPGGPSSAEVVAGRVRNGGLFVAHNIFWGGRGLDIFSPGRDSVEDGIRTFTRSLLANREFLTSVLPLGDGVAMALKVGA